MNQIPSNARIVDGFHFYDDEEETNACKELAKAQVSLRNELTEASQDLRQLCIQHSYTSTGTELSHDDIYQRELLPSLTLSSCDTNSEVPCSNSSQASSGLLGLISPRHRSTEYADQSQISLSHFPCEPILKRLETSDDLISPTHSEKSKQKYAFFALSDEDERTASDDSSYESSLKITTMEDDYWSSTEVDFSEDEDQSNQDCDIKVRQINVENQENSWTTADPQYTDNSGTIIGPTEQGSGGLFDVFSRMLLVGAWGAMSNHKNK